MSADEVAVNLGDATPRRLLVDWANNQDAWVRQLVAASLLICAHAIVEQVIADLKNGPLAHLPSGHFWANSAWLVCATMAFNLTRTAGALASTFHAKVTTGTIRAQLITVPGRLARSARRLTLHLPTGWPWHKQWEQLAATATSPPLAA